jgi:DNA gyrase/topoisomerase IV subunit B
MTQRYDEQSIKVLDPIEAIRKRPGMYIGSLVTGAFHIVKEAIDNGVDEFLAGHSDQVSVELDTKTNTATITDWGRGIPVKIHSKTGISTLTTIFTQTHAGGKFDKEAYNTAVVGLHGVGVTVSNALSKTLQVWTHREGKCHTQSFERGRATSEVVSGKTAGDWSTRIVLVPDEKIFQKYTKLKADTLRRWLRDLSYLCPKLKITCIVDGEPEEYFSKDGLRDMLKEIADAESLGDVSKDMTFTGFAEGEGQKIGIDLVVTWTDYDGTLMRQYSNCIFNGEGGTPTEAFWDAYVKAVKQSTNETVTAADLRYGVVGIIHVKVDNPIYKGQTKDRLENPEVHDIVQAKLVEEFKEFFVRNANLLKSVVQRAQELGKMRERFKLDKQALKKIKLVDPNSPKGLPTKLVKALNVDAKDRWLYLVEGDSAGGSAVMARVKNAQGKLFQEVLPLRGKIINASRSEMAKVLDNREVQDIINAISSGILDQCNPKRARVGRICLLADPDVDGFHITSLLCSLFIHYMFPLVEQGMVWFVKSPRLVAKYKNDRFFGNTLKSLRKQIDEKSRVKVDPNTLKPFIVTYLKGHGEATSAEIRQYAMDPATAKFRMLTTKSDSDAEIRRIMGSDSDMRKQLLGLT